MHKAPGPRRVKGAELTVSLGRPEERGGCSQHQDHEHREHTRMHRSLNRVGRSWLAPLDQEHETPSRRPTGWLSADNKSRCVETPNNLPPALSHASQQGCSEHTARPPNTMTLSLRPVFPAEGQSCAFWEHPGRHSAQWRGGSGFVWETHWVGSGKLRSSRGLSAGPE